MSSGLRKAIRSLKRTLLGEGKVDILGKQYQVAYDARGSWVEDDYSLLRELARGKSCILDVGANKGLTALLMADFEKGGVVYAFEPSQQACETISRNALLNGLADRIFAIDALVAENSGAVRTFYSGCCSVFASMVKNPNLPDLKPLLKSTLALDDFVSYTLIEPDFIKIDVEGAEKHVILGMKRILSRFRPTVFVEVHPLSGQTAGENAVNILHHLAEVNYRMVRVRTHKEVTSTIDFDGVTGRSYVLLLPREVELPSWFPAFDTHML
jgi:FkbM family methyltransferase